MLNTSNLALLFAGALGMTLLSVWLQRRKIDGRWLFLAAIGVLAGTGWAWSEFHKQEANNQVFFATRVPNEDFSRGYITSDKCASCHPKEYASWEKTFHRTMTQYANANTVHADFDNVTLHLDDKAFNLSRKGDEFFAELENPDIDKPTTALPRVTRRVGMLTGSHHMQVFWVPSIPGNIQVDLPFAYLLEDKRWVPTTDTFLRDPNLPRSRSFWNQTCLECHTTAGNPGVKRIEGTPGMRPEITMETHLGEMGIGCESCHGPGSQHAEANANPLRRYQLRLEDKGDSTIVNPARLSPKAASEICGQCHSAHGYDQNQFYAHGVDYRPGSELTKSIALMQPTKAGTDPHLAAAIHQKPDLVTSRFWPDGKIRVSGRDYNGLIESPCYKSGELSCLSCHSMHKSSPVNQLREDLSANQTCAQCHTQIGKDIAQHTHHESSSSGSLCYNCHMPYTTYGLLKAIRSHTIESPDVSTTISTGRANACNLCHLDKSLGWTSDRLAEWYGKKPPTLLEDQKTISAAVSQILSGDAGERALVSWAMGWEPARQASGEDWLPPYLAQSLTDPYSAVRYIAGHSLQRAKGFENFKYDFIASAPERERERTDALEIWARASRPKRRGADVLITSDGQLEEEKFRSILLKRNDRSIDLKE